MTNLVAAIIITVSTNWQTTGTFTPTIGTAHEVQVGYLVTNTVAIFTWKDVMRSHILETNRGPDIGERRIPRIERSVGGGIMFTNITYPSLPYLTNYPSHIGN